MITSISLTCSPPPSTQPCQQVLLLLRFGSWCHSAQGTSAAPACNESGCSCTVWHWLVVSCCLGTMGQPEGLVLRDEEPHCPHQCLGQVFSLISLGSASVSHHPTMSQWRVGHSPIAPCRFRAGYERVALLGSQCT